MSTLPLFIALVAGQATQKKVDVRLVDLTPVTQVAKAAVFKMSKEFSIGGIILHEGVVLAPQGDTTPDRSGRLVYSVPRGSNIFYGHFGIPDTDTDGTGEATLAISVDGEAIQEIKASSGQKPTKFEVKLSNAKSLMLSVMGTGALGDANFSTSGSAPASKPNPPEKKPEEKKPEEKKPQETPAKPPSEMERVNLTAPENGEIAKEKITFKWDAVADATNYGVEIVMIVNADPKKTPTRYLRAFSAKSESFEWNFSDDVLSGEYQVSVIAFGKKGVLTKFSNAKRFKVTRK